MGDGQRFVILEDGLSNGRMADSWVRKALELKEQVADYPIGYGGERTYGTVPDGET